MEKTKEINLYNGCWCGVKVDSSSIEKGYLNYYTLAKTFDTVLCNNIVNIDEYLFDNVINGNLYYQEEFEEMKEIYQFYIIDDYGKEILENYTNEIILYSDLIDCYIWGVTHFGTPWTSVFTDIKIKQ